MDLIARAVQPATPALDVVQMTPPRKVAIELDVLRGLAAVLMIVNHGGYRLLGPEATSKGLLGALVFVGSFAPVLFFFATGFGVALSVNASGRAPDLRSTCVKAFLLLVADQLMFWRTGSWWGLNFLGFIGVSLLLVSVIARSRNAIIICCACIAGILLLRYGVAPKLADAAAPGGWSMWIAGVRGMRDMPYPPAPWLVYPLAGFVLGRLYAEVDLGMPVPRDRWVKFGLVALTSLAAIAGALAARGAPYFRWGTVSAGYFVLSLAGVIGAGLLSMYIAIASRRLAAALSLRGVASFAVIPLHYGLLELVAPGANEALDGWSFMMLIGVIVTACWLTSERFSRIVSTWTAGPHRAASAWALAALLLVAVVASLGLGADAAPLPMVAMVVGQLSVAGLLAVRVSPRSARARA
jgi:hypothetical protein